MTTIVRLQREAFDVAAEVERMTHGRTDIGAVVTFTGLCRADENGKPIAALTPRKLQTTAPSPLGDQPRSSTSFPTPDRARAAATTRSTRSATGCRTPPSVSPACRRPAARPRRGSVTATFTVSNTGTVAGTDVVPVYVHQPVSVVLVPNQRLVGFTRVTLNPGQVKTVLTSRSRSRNWPSRQATSAAAPPRRWNSAPIRCRSARLPP